MAYDNGTVKVISVPISKDAHKKLMALASDEKRSKTAQAGYLLEKLLLTAKEG